MKLSTASGAPLAALLLTGCSSERPALITEASTASGDPSRVRIDLDACNSELSVDLIEQDDEVRVTVTATDDQPEPFAQWTVVDLGRPLGDRDLIDGNTETWSGSKTATAADETVLRRNAGT